MTSARLVGDAREVTVGRPDGSRLTARVLGRRQDVGIAALRVDDSGLPPLHSGSGLSEARGGDRAFAIGASGAVTVSSLRALDGDGDSLEVIGIDAKVPPGSVGGPLVDEDGYVLGVLTGADGGSGGAAIPVDIARSAALGIVRNS